MITLSLVDVLMQEPLLMENGVFVVHVIGPTLESVVNGEQEQQQYH